MGGRPHGGPTMDESWKSDLDRWLAPFLGAFRHKTRARMCPVYVAGLIGVGDRKSVQPMAARDGEVSYDQLHHFIASGVWDAAPLENALLAEADKMVGCSVAWLIVDDTALPKKGEHSVGVAPQYASSLGKTANCQSQVSLTLASREVPVMVGLRLFLPESWTDDPERMARARVPEDRRTALTKPEIAIEDERLTPALVVGEATARAVGQAMGVEMVFRHIDGWYRSASFPRLCLSFGALPRVSVRAKGKDDGRSNCRTTPRTVRGFPIRPSPLSRGLPPSRSGPFSPQRHEKS